MHTDTKGRPRAILAVLVLAAVIAVLGAVTADAPTTFERDNRAEEMSEPARFACLAKVLNEHAEQIGVESGFEFLPGSEKANRFSIQVPGGQRGFSTVDGTLYWERSIGPLERADGSVHYGSCDG
ncbi:MAG: hypothetical protein KG028_04845 [Actinobacteria bacterium]|nr:hypothetical protein [Actinomycetota bacterium]